MADSEPQNGIIEAPVDTSRIRRIYDLLSRFYFLAAPLENRARTKGVEMAGIRPREKVLEVAVGAGYAFLQMLRRVDRSNTVYGLDISPAMLDKTGKLAGRNGYTNFALVEGDARCLPFRDGSFDLIYNSYMMNLLPIAGLSTALAEYRRVLKKDGRIVLVNLSKKGPAPVLLEKIYRLNPYLCAGCRPVLLEPFVERAGFRGVTRAVVKTVLLSEIILAMK